MFQLAHRYMPQLSRAQVKRLWKALQAPARARRDVGAALSMKDLKASLSSLRESLKNAGLELFLIVLFMMIVGEMFASPVEKIADDSWFDFLERIDDLEKYGKQRVWGSVAFTLIPVLVTLAVDYTPCQLTMNIHHFLIHFYLFGGLMAATFLTSFFYPLPPPSKHKYVSKVGKGLKIICCDGRGTLYTVTLLVMGVVYASYNNYLFWLLQDLRAQEINMGLCITVSSFAEIPILMLSSRLVSRLGNAWVITIALIILAGRVLYYSFLWIPWAVLPIELTHAFTHTSMWYGVLSYEEFNVNPAVDRSIRSILSSFYFGLGFSAGSIISGLTWDHFGSAILYQSASVLAAVWCILFTIIHKCIPEKERIKYSKLLSAVDDSEDSNNDADDWLEMALKEH